VCVRVLLVCCRGRWLLGLLVLQSTSSFVLDSYQDLLKVTGTDKAEGWEDFRERGAVGVLGVWDALSPKLPCCFWLINMLS